MNQVEDNKNIKAVRSKRLYRYLVSKQSKAGKKEGTFGRRRVPYQINNGIHTTVDLSKALSCV